MSDTPTESAEELPAFPEDRFDDVQYICAGRNATVFTAIDRVLRRRVALKIATEDGLLSPAVRCRLAELGIEDGFAKLVNETRGIHGRYTLLREARLLACVDHPNVVPVIEIGRLDDGAIAVVMPLLSNGTLPDQDLGRRWRHVLDIALQIGEGLAAIHEAGILHRDFKPNNILFGADGRPRIADLGLACKLDDAEAMAEHVGTGQFMAPEVLRGKFRDQRDDLYAYCMVVFEMFFGHLPFASIQARLNGEVSSIRRRGGMSSQLRRVLIRGLHPDPEQRWPDMHTLLNAMRRTKSSPRTWIAGSVVGAAATALALAVFGPTRTLQADVCDEVDDEIAQIWNETKRGQLQEVLGTRKAGDNLQAWTTRWVNVRARECDAAERANRETRPTPCTASMRARFEATVKVLSLPHFVEHSSYPPVIADLPAPEHCLDHPLDTEPGYGSLLDLRDIEIEVQALVSMGELERARTRQADYSSRARARSSDYGIARALLWRGEILRLDGDLDAAEQDFELVYAQSQSLDAPLLGAEAMMKLAMIAGARGKYDVVEAHALTALPVFAHRDPDRVAELYEVHGTALISGPKTTRMRGLALLIRAVELRTDQLRRYGGTRERLSQARQSLARALLMAGEASEALEKLDLALRDHQDEFGDRTWRTRGILRQKFLALLELGRLAEARAIDIRILELAVDEHDVSQYLIDAHWIADGYQRARYPNSAIAPLQMGRKLAAQHGLVDQVARFDLEFDKVEAK